MGIQENEVGPVCPDCGSRNLTSREEPAVIPLDDEQQSPMPVGKRPDLSPALMIFYWRCDECGTNFKTPCR